MHQQQHSNAQLNHPIIAKASVTKKKVSLHRPRSSLNLDFKVRTPTLI